MYVEIQTFLPREDPAVFEQAVKVAKEAGATSLRVVCLLGRRYEMFETLADWRTAVAGFHHQIAVAVPIVEKYRMPLGIENHKDWRVDEQVALLERYSSELLGVSLDTGNNLTVLDDPMETVEKLAPYTVNVHFKDMAVEETADGFRISEVPLGEGMLDMPTHDRDHPRGAARRAILARDDHARSARRAVPDGQVLVDVRRRRRLALSRTLTRIRANPPARHCRRSAAFHRKLVTRWR